jgi:hypothetical protein
VSVLVRGGGIGGFSGGVCWYNVGATGAVS